MHTVPIKSESQRLITSLTRGADACNVHMYVWLLCTYVYLAQKPNMYLQLHLLQQCKSLFFNAEIQILGTVQILFCTNWVT